MYTGDLPVIDHIPTFLWFHLKVFHTCLGFKTLGIKSDTDSLDCCEVW